MGDVSGPDGWSPSVSAASVGGRSLRQSGADAEVGGLQSRRWDRRAVAQMVGPPSGVLSRFESDTSMLRGLRRVGPPVGGKVPAPIDIDRSVVRFS